MSYLIWSEHTEPGHCVLAPTRIKNVGKLHAGETVPADFTQSVQYRMSDLFPDDVALSDSYEVAGQVIVSPQLRKALEPHLQGQSMQYLPVRILNHKGRLAADDYCILHLHAMVDCIDIEKSKVHWNELNTTKIESCAGLVLKPIAANAPPLFRLVHWGMVIAVRDTVAKELLSGKFIGLRFAEPRDHIG